MPTPMHWNRDILILKQTGASALTIAEFEGGPSAKRAAWRFLQLCDPGTYHVEFAPSYGDIVHRGGHGPRLATVTVNPDRTIHVQKELA